MRLQPILIDVVMSPEAQTLVECWTASQYEPNNFDYMVQYAKAKVALWGKLGLNHTMSDVFNFQDGILAITCYEVKKMIEIQDHRTSNDIELGSLDVNEAFFCKGRLFVVSDKRPSLYSSSTVKCHCLSDTAGPNGEALVELNRGLLVSPIDLLITVQDYKNAN